MEEEDYVEIHGKRILKPFVEKPVDGVHVLLPALQPTLFRFYQLRNYSKLYTECFSLNDFIHVLPCSYHLKTMANA